MAQIRFFVVCLVLGSSVLPRTEAHSSGAPTAACSTLTPNHQSASSVPGGAPRYVLSAPKTVAAGSTAVVTIGGAPFKGFIVRVMDANGQEAGSQFIDRGAGARYQAIDCDAPSDTATHTDGSDKNQIQLEWRAPTVPGLYRIVATIVQEFSTYYTGYSTDVLVQ